MPGWSRKRTGLKWDYGAGVSTIKNNGTSSRIYSHRFVPFQNARFIRGDLPNRPIELQTLKKGELT